MAAILGAEIDGERCQNCKGSGLVLVCDGIDHSKCKVEDCLKCEGKGYITDGE